MTNNTFETIKRENQHHQEYWSARELYKLLGYTEYGKFLPAIERAKKACKNSGEKVEYHFAHLSDMISIATGTVRETMRESDNYHLSRYACYLIAQNGDPQKKEIALAQTYFVIQTRRQEVQEQLIEDGKRVSFRDEITYRNKSLSQAAKKAGVVNYSQFNDFGYMGLYGGMRQKDIHAKKKLKPNEKILDHMGSEELGANIFRATQAEAKLRREGIRGEHSAGKMHYEVGKKVRETIKELGGTMPEQLPSVEHVKQAKKRVKQADRQEKLASPKGELNNL